MKARLAVVLGIALAGALSSACRQASPASSVRLASADQLPPAVQRSAVTVRDAYRFALANAELLKQVPCYCGCGAMGHTSNLACYVKPGSAADAPVFDDHALGCSICVDITHDVMRLSAEGKTIAQIRSYVEGRYAQLGPPNRP